MLLSDFCIEDELGDLKGWVEMEIVFEVGQA